VGPKAAAAVLRPARSRPFAFGAPQFTRTEQLIVRHIRLRHDSPHLVGRTSRRSHPHAIMTAVSFHAGLCMRALIVLTTKNLFVNRIRIACMAVPDRRRAFR